jgi:hypothetical protein
MASSMKLQLCMRCWKPVVERLNCVASKRFGSTAVVSKCQSTISIAFDSGLCRRNGVTTALSVDRYLSAMPTRRAVITASAGLCNSRRYAAATGLLPSRNETVGGLPYFINGSGRFFAVSLGNGNMMQLARNVQQVRAFSTSGDGSSSSDDSWASSSNNESSDGSSSDEGPGVPDGGESDLTPPLVALSPMTVPEVWPRVPVIAVRRHPLFPRFIKMIEVLIYHCRYLLDLHHFI